MSIDTGMGIALGAFTPLSAYEEIRPIFHLFTKAMITRDAQESCDDDLKAYYHKRDELHLRIETDEAQFVSSEWIHIVDLSSDADSHEIEIKFSNYRDIETLSQELAPKQR